MEHWVRATKYGTGNVTHEVYINLSMAVNIARMGNHTEIEFSGGIKAIVKEQPDQLFKACKINPSTCVALPL